VGSVADRGTGLPRLSTPPTAAASTAAGSAGAAPGASPAAAAANSAAPTPAGPSPAAVAGEAGGILLVVAMVAAGFRARARLGRLG
jgi:hypothetical protein